MVFKNFQTSLTATTGLVLASTIMVVAQAAESQQTVTYQTTMSMNGMDSMTMAMTTVVPSSDSVASASMSMSMSMSASSSASGSADASSSQNGAMLAVGHGGAMAVFGGAGAVLMML